MEVKPGYKLTEVGVIPEDWSIKSLGVVAGGIYRGASPRPIDNPAWFDDGSSIGWVRISDVTQSGRYLFETTQRLSAVGVLKSRYVPIGSLIMSICATVGRPIETRINVCIHDGFVVFERLGISQQFLFHVLTALEPSWGKRGQTGSQMNLNTGIIKRTQIPIPPTVTEQQAIAEALSDADTLIESLEQLIAKKRQVRQGAMQELLTGNRRLPGFGGEWKVYRLGEIAEIIMGQSPGSAHYNTKGDGLPLVQGNADISNRQTIRRVFTTEITKRGKCGDILMSVRAPVGEISRAVFDICLGRGVCAIRYPNDFLYYALIAKESQWVKISKGSTFDSVSSTEIKTFEIEIPTDEKEQVAIVTIFSDMDTEIETLEQKLAKARQVKQGMMQELLTGRIRLV